MNGSKEANGMVSWLYFRKAIGWPYHVGVDLGKGL